MSNERTEFYKMVTNVTAETNKTVTHVQKELGIQYAEALSLLNLCTLERLLYAVSSASNRSAADEENKQDTP